MSEKMKYYTIQDVAKMLNLTESKIYYEIDTGRLESEELVGKKVVTDIALKAFKKINSIQNVLLTPAEFCKKHKMSRSKFDYRVRAGKIQIAKLGGKVFVKGMKDDGGKP